ncbi:zf-HC2 domain-containing protein [Bittarella massiliensis (ex Durand et al. 2017)]|uniref:zf-HC2 domain-containing protein n=1 Tax=Bittarella massiliensis (ex Durand et al. 2017) TaxID=1720313 RepID=UPI001AA0B8EC|nr:zf-HC2 domain-containing protein [Bittarella massiliensis (ex Durand et al. 2017)]MBO1678633.1 zf-HC2 domain-containing protein [Bittarella massiliensis (ex Durand et al. 2017)]
MTLFDRDGHLTGQALAALQAGGLTGESRLEVAEHLASCDRCVAAYSAQLSPEVLLTPREPVAPRVMETLRRRERRLRLRQWGTMAVAACLAIVFWVSGVFTGSFWSRTEGEEAPSLVRQTAAFVDQVSQKTGDLMNRFDLREVFQNEKE